MLGRIRVLSPLFGSTVLLFESLHVVVAVVVH